MPTTVAPSLANATAVALPIPRAAPVMIATFPFNRFDMSAFLPKSSPADLGYPASRPYDPRRSQAAQTRLDLAQILRRELDVHCADVLVIPLHFPA
jgi:hypothetical protein